MQDSYPVLFISLDTPRVLIIAKARDPQDCVKELPLLFLFIPFSFELLLRKSLQPFALERNYGITYNLWLPSCVYTLALFYRINQAVKIGSFAD
jgi:hypothetical protein